MAMSGSGLPAMPGRELVGASGSERQIPMTEQNKETQKRESFYAKLQEKMFDLIQSSAVYLKHAPKDEKLGLCLDIKKQQYEVYRLIVRCAKRHWNKSTLVTLDTEHEVMRENWKLFYRLGYFDCRRNAQEHNPAEAVRRFNYINDQVDELGKMIGGLIKFLSAQGSPSQ